MFVLFWLHLTIKYVPLMYLMHCCVCTSHELVPFYVIVLKSKEWYSFQNKPQSGVVERFGVCFLSFFNPQYL